MIVTCERCTTQFQLDDTRVPETGVRVRCSRCKHAFQVERPARNELEKIHRVARRALEESEEGPDITQDLPPSSVVDASGGPGPADREFLDDGESDWEFNDGAPAGGSPSGPEVRRAAQSAVDAMLSGSPQSGSDAEAGSDFGDALDEGDALELEIGGEPRSAPAEASEEDGLDLETDPGGLELEAPPAPAAPEAEAREGESEALGSPSEWDIFEEPPPPRVEVLAPAAPAPAIERRATPSPEVFDEAEEGGGVWLQRLGAGVGWMATAGLCAAALVMGLAPRPPAASAAPFQVGGVRVEQVSARWVENLERGPLYVVSGWLRNRGDTSTAADRLTLVLRDDAGRPVGEPAPLGAVPDPGLLREAPLAAIRRAQARSDAALPAALAPRQGVRFAVVVSPVPEAASRFDFEVAPADEPAQAGEAEAAGPPGPPAGGSPDAAAPGS